ncbi:MAG: 50S ribosomal protein L9 [Chloroflexi bacterium OLB15]|nr:MAG: 50S ribosomal protein L9 [Chloroflexi bacterium OLB15]
MKVILLSDVYKHGVAGEVVDVADGFARNWLIPKKLATKASPEALKKHEEMREASATRKAALEGRLNDLARQIDGVELLFGRRASPTGKLFGSVTTSEIADALNDKTGIDINRRRISQTQLREVGIHDVPVRLGTEISPILKVQIVREEDYAKVLAQKAASAEAAAIETIEADPEIDAEAEAEAAGVSEAIAEVSAEAEAAGE